MINTSLEMYGCHFQPLHIILRDNPHEVKSFVSSALPLNDEWEATGAAATAALCSKRDGGVGGTKGPWV